MKIVVVGGGVSGVCCIEELCRLGPQHEITLVSASSILKVQSMPGNTQNFTDNIIT